MASEARRERGGRRVDALALLAGLLGCYFLAAFGHALSQVTEAGALMVAAGVLAVILLCAQAPLEAALRRRAVGVVIAASFLAQVAWATWADPQPIDDMARLLDAARRFGASLGVGAPDWRLVEESPSPAALWLYAATMLVFGDALSVLRFAAAGLWAWQIWLVWRIALETPALEARALAVAALFGLAPAVLIYGGVPSVEAVFGVAALAALLGATRGAATGAPLWFAVAGAAAAAAFLTKPLGAALILALALWLGLRARRRARAFRPVLAFCLGLCLGLAPQALLHAARSGDLSVAAGPALGYELLIGSSRASGGAFNDVVSAADLREAGFIGAEATPMREANRRAVAIALERWLSDPVGAATLAFGEKLRRIWGSQREMLVWSLAWRLDAPPADRGARAVAAAVIDGGWLALLAAATLGALRIVAARVRGAGRGASPALLLAALAAFAFGALLLEARPRQHLAATPLLACLAALAAPRRAPLRLRDFQLPRFRRPAPPAPTPAPAPPPLLAAPEAVAPPPHEPAFDPARASAEARLAHALKRMSKPPRRDGAPNPRRKGA